MLELINITVNVDLQYRLVNGQLGTVKHISTGMKDNILKVYAKFDDCNAGLKKVNSDNFGQQHSWVFIEKCEVDILIK